MRPISHKKREALAAYGFLLPNFLGFLLFTSIPVVVSLVMAFTHWNIFKPPTWVGLENFVSLLGFHREGGQLTSNDPFFWQYVYNTVYLMAGIPIGMAASLMTALIMNQRIKGIVIFRTLYFLPAVCSGVALLILWKYLYNADIGLINESIRLVGESIYASKPLAIGLTVFAAVLFGIVTLATVALFLSFVRWLSEKLKLTWPEWLFRMLMVCAGAAIFIGTGVYGRQTYSLISFFFGSLLLALLLSFVHWLSEKLKLTWPEWLFSGLIVCAGAAIFIGTGVHGRQTYSLISFFFSTPPDWLGTVQWAKPSLILMGLWGGLGGYNMILYLAALQGVPTSYYEAAEIDGAGPWQKFWAVTWPMISPTTFFILVMSVIGGFQGGFMIANVMTGGGPAGSTTTVEYYLYQTAFEKFNMGYASAIAWFLFAVILLMTMLTWRIGGRVVTYE